MSSSNYAIEILFLAKCLFLCVTIIEMFIIKKPNFEIVASIISIASIMNPNIIIGIIIFCN